jgi:hypothetical protein
MATVNGGARFSGPTRRLAARQARLQSPHSHPAEHGSQSCVAVGPLRAGYRARLDQPHSLEYSCMRKNNPYLLDITTNSERTKRRE